MSNNEEFFELSTEALFEKTRNDVQAFMNEMNDNNLLNVIFSLNHLREWIYPPGYNAYREKNAGELTAEEQIHSDLHNDENYQIIRKLCNRAKHVQISNSNHQTEMKEGLIAGIARAGDRLGQRNYLVDNKDIRTIMANVLSIYETYFNK